MARDCGECGEEISEVRLKARPSATLCIKCQERQDTVEFIDNMRQATSGGYINMGHIHKRWMNAAEHTTRDWVAATAKGNNAI